MTGLLVPRTERAAPLLVAPGDDRVDTAPASGLDTAAAGNGLSRSLEGMGYALGPGLRAPLSRLEPGPGGPCPDPGRSLSLSLSLSQSRSRCANGGRPGGGPLRGIDVDRHRPGDA